MADLLQAAGEAVQELVRSAGYVGIFIGALVDTLFPPLPSELIMPLGGFLVGRGELGYAGVVAAGTLGSVTGALVIYSLGAWADERIIRRAIRRYGRLFGLSEDGLDRVLAAFSRHGALIVIFGRVVPGIRTWVSIPAGMERMPPAKFLLFTATGTAVWSGILAYAGMVLGDNWEDVARAFGPFRDVLVVAGIVGAGLIAVLLFARYVLGRRDRA